MSSILDQANEKAISIQKSNDDKSDIGVGDIERTGLDISEKQAAAVQVTDNRVTLDSIKDKIDTIEYVYPKTCPHFTIAIVITENGFTSLGQSAPADPANFDKALGQKFALENAIGKLWPMEGYLLCEKMFKKD